MVREHDQGDRHRDDYAQHIGGREKPTDSGVTFAIAPGDHLLRGAVAGAVGVPSAELQRRRRPRGEIAVDWESVADHQPDGRPSASDGASAKA
jgi:hypothetical protein